MKVSKGFNLSDDLVILRDESGCWRLENGENSFSLYESSDFKRVISLLEIPIENAKSALGLDFPYKSVAKIGLRHDSDYWIKLAISWVAESSTPEALSFIDDLKKISTDKDVSQINRQLAKKELKRLLNT